MSVRLGTAKPAVHPTDPAKQASVWLARLERGLREEEAEGLREWLGVRANREAILEQANLWSAPDVNTLLQRLIPKDTRKTKQRVWRRVVSVTFTAIGLACSIVLSVTLLSGRMPWTYFDGSAEPPRVSPNETYRTGIG